MATNDKQPELLASGAGLAAGLATDIALEPKDQAVALELYMVGVIVSDMRRAVEFYRRLGVAIPAGGEDLEHVEVPMRGTTFFLNTRRSNAKWDPATSDPSGGYRIILEFYLETREGLDAKYAEMVAFGYEGHRAPYDVTDELRFAMVDDPDGNTILLSSPTSSSGSVASGGDSFASSANGPNGDSRLSGSSAQAGWLPYADDVPASGSADWRAHWRMR